MRVILAFIIGLSACGGSVTAEHEGNRDPLNGPAATPVTAVNENTSGPRKGKPTEKVMTEESTLSRMVLSAKAEKTATSLVIDYEVENRTDQVLYLGDRMIDFEGDNTVISKDLAYVFFEDPKKLNIIRANLTLPKSLRVASKEIPYVRPVAGGAKVTGRIVVALPAKEFSPYFGYSDPENADLKDVSEVRLILGWTDYREGMTVREHNIGGEDVLALRGGWAPPYQYLLEKTFAISLQCLVAKSDFERNMPLK